MILQRFRIFRPVLFFASSIARTMTTQTDCVAPDAWAQYKVLENQKISPNTNILRIATPPGRPILGWDPNIPTCISVQTIDPFDTNTTLSKSYSPISHPSTQNEFSLLVKSYEPQPGGGVGHYLCGLQKGDELTAKVKASRVMHGDAAVLQRGWTHVGFVGGGTGVAPLYQLLLLLLEDGAEELSFLNIHSTADDVLLGNELEDLRQKYPDRLKVTTVLTQEDKDTGRGTLDLVKKTLPDPALGDRVMIFVCGKYGFVDFWCGEVTRAPPPPGKKKGPKIQGPLLGLLKDAGYNSSQVFKY